MKTYLVTILLGLVLLAQAAAELSGADKAAIEQLTKEYASWNYCGRPIEFRNRLDVASYDEQRPILIELAELDWNGFWGDHWRKCGVPDLATLKALSPSEFLIRYHESPDNRLLKDDDHFSAAKIAIDIHTISEARGMAYVVYTFTHDGRKPTDDGTFYVLRAIHKKGQWLLVAFPGTASALRGQLANLKLRKSIK